MSINPKDARDLPVASDDSEVFDFDHDDFQSQDFDDPSEDDDEFDMSMDSEEDPDEPVINYTLDSLIVRIADLVEQRHLSIIDLRQLLFDGSLKKLCEERDIDYEELLLSSQVEDQAYNQLLLKLYPSYAKFLKPTEYHQSRSLLITLLAQALDQLEDTQPQQQVETPDADIDPEVEAYTMRVLNVYKDLFEVGFELKIPFGILIKDGALRLDKGKTKITSNGSFANLYSLINDLTGRKLVQSEVLEDVAARDLRSISMRRGTSYYPQFHLGNLFGILQDKTVGSWEELSRFIRPEIFRNIKDNLADGKDIGSIVEALTTCIVISDFNVGSAISLRINVGNSRITEGAFQTEYASRKSTIFAGNGSVYHCRVLPSGIMEIILVFSQAAYNGRPLFAYEAVESLQARGKAPSLRNMILGQDTSGKILTINLDTQQSSIILVGAGQRSGKGVLTLNLLGTVLSEACPMIYLDAKPDMAPVLWSVAEKYGVEAAVWDIFENNGHQMGSGAPENVAIENPGIFGVLLYFKVLQLMMVAASLQAKGVSLGNGNRPFFIFDEAFATQMTLAANWQKVLDIAKDKSADPDDKAWALALVKWVEGLDSDLAAVINSQLPKSGISTVWLFQSMQPTSWNPYAVSGLGANKMNILKKPIESRLSLKFLGRGTADSEYALGNVKIKEDRVIQNRVLNEGGRHFVMTGSQKITSMDAVTVFKPYLVLNESENGSKSAEELKSNVSSEVLTVIAPDGSLDSRAGFEGFALMLGQTAIKNMALGREYLEDVLRHVGLLSEFGSLDGYLYDASMSSFKTLGYILRGVNDTSATEESLYTPSFDSTVDGSDQDSDDSFDYMPEDSATSEEQSTPRDPSRSPGAASSVVSGQPSSRPSVYEASKEDSPNNQMHYDGQYSNPIQVKSNPFIAYGNKDKPLSAINAIQEMSKLILQEITRMVGDLSRVESFEVTTRGLVINNIAFRPQFSPEVIASLPFDIKNQVEQGNLVELFHFGNISKFKNLVVLRIDNSRLAEGRVRREIGLPPSRLWSSLFRRFRYLKDIYIGGERINDEVTAKSYDDHGRGGFSLTEALRDKFKIPVSFVSNSRVERIWHSRPARILGGALGVTLGVKTLLLAAPLFGAWTLLFGALSGYGILREMRRTRPGK